MKFADYRHCRDKKNEVYKYLIDYMNVNDKYGNKIWTILSDIETSDISCYIFPHMSDHFTNVCEITFDWYGMFIECHWYYKFRNSIIAKMDMGDISLNEFSKWFIGSVEHFINFAGIMENV